LTQLSDGQTDEDEIEISIDDLSDDIMLTLRKLVNNYMPKKQKNHKPQENYR